MNIYNRRLSRLVAIAATVMALVAYPYFPEKRYLVTGAPGIDQYLYGVKLPDGSSVASWINESERKFRCLYPAGIPVPSYYCSYNLGYGFEQNGGMDLSRYNHINLSIEYTGSASKIRFFARNYNELYSKKNDFNTTKYNAIFMSTKDITQEITLNMNEFLVTEWWRLQYGISRANSFAELDNIVSLGIDFSDYMTVGNHDVKVNKIEFVGEWISRESWYLIIISVWLSAVFVNTVNQLRQFRKQKIVDEKVILELNEYNENLVKETDKFRKLSTVDALTQSYNRFGIDQVVTTLIASSEKATIDKPPFSLIVLDIDHFKRVNDRRGHDAGDRVLKQVAETINRSVREGDYTGRWGGEEFVIILPFTGHEFALALAEKIRIMVGHSEFEPEDPLVVTVSAGVGSLLEEESFSDLFKRVDEALYAAKATGRNCCCVAERQNMDYLVARV